MVGNNDKLFDAYFSYCLKDDQCVSQIARELGPGYRLCLHQQNVLGNNRNSGEAALSAAKASARTVIVISKAFLASEWDHIKTFLLGPESGDISGNVIIILLEDMFDYENIQDKDRLEILDNLKKYSSELNSAVLNPDQLDTLLLNPEKKSKKHEKIKNLAQVQTDLELSHFFTNKPDNLKNFEKQRN